MAMHGLAVNRPEKQTLAKLSRGGRSIAMLCPRAYAALPAAPVTATVVAMRVGEPDPPPS